ncbi:MAG: Fe-S cluster assembly protein SufD [Gammaproteobacteria bacterium]|nr:Fe-S cluster assembly protein SufD [Gammaproteobacteria bacterium]MCW5582894.1 Fe-S cluster assembly protein SufD [Gammaproteobacteria bacterium]
MNALPALPTWMQKDNLEISAPQMPDWLIKFRRAHWEDFLKHGLPTRKDERWKYTDLIFLANKPFANAKQESVDYLVEIIHQYRLQRSESIMIVFVNGYFVPVLSDLAKLPSNVIACNMDTALQQYPEMIKANWPSPINAHNYPFGSLNVAMFNNGLFLWLPDSCQLTMPIHLLSLAIGEDEFITHPHHLFVLGQNSKLELVEEYFSLVSHSYMMNIVTTINAGKNAKLDYYKIQQESKQAVHMAHTFIHQQQNSQVSLTNFSFGSLFARDDVVIKLQEAGADCHTSGFYHLRHDNQYVDNHIDISHAAPHSHSEMLYKGIVDKKSRAVFNGRLCIEKNAQKILAYQANHNLLLSNEAEVYSKPELEIYADDVKCKHGATTGQLDQEALFYLRSRGIEREKAIAMLLQGFSEEIIQRITHPGIKLRVQEISDYSR